MEALRVKTQRENAVPDDMSMSSMGESSYDGGRENSFSLSQSEAESQSHFKIHSGLHPSPNPPVTLFNDTTDCNLGQFENRFNNNAKNKNKNKTK